jgi:hypothetical protein
MVNLDRNSPKILRGWLPELASAKEVRKPLAPEEAPMGWENHLVIFI